MSKPVGQWQGNLELKEGQKIATQLTGLALKWAVVVWRKGGTITYDYSAFVKELKFGFDHPEPDPIPGGMLRFGRGGSACDGLA